MSFFSTFRSPASNSVQNAHRTSLLKNIERRLEVAKQKGNDVLVGQLEDERHQLAL